MNQTFTITSALLASALISLSPGYDKVEIPQTNYFRNVAVSRDYYSTPFKEDYFHEGINESEQMRIIEKVYNALIQNQLETDSKIIALENKYFWDLI